METIVSNAKALNLSYSAYCLYAVERWGCTTYELITRTEYSLA